MVLRRAGVVVGTSLLLAVIGLYYSGKLYSNLRTNFEELLPTSARAVTDLSEVRARLVSIDSLAVLVFSDDIQGSRRFIEDLATRLEKAPRDVVASVEYRIDKELQFFKSRQALFMSPEDLLTIRNYVRARLEYERELYNPLNIVREEELHQPRLKMESLKDKYAKDLSSYEHFPDGLYATTDQKKRVLLAYVPGNSSGIENNKRLKAAVEEAIAALNPKSYAQDLEIKYTSGVQDALEEHAALMADLELSTVLVVIVVSIAMWLFFRNLRATIALVGSLFVGTFWTFGLSYFLEGFLNANSAFLGSIVIGNGINFGIIVLARYLEERREGRSHARATILTLRGTATATLTAALAAGLSYGSLALTSFRGFRQFGVIGLVGMVLCWLSAYLCLPSFLTLLDRLRPLVKRGTPAPKNRVAAAFAWIVNRFPGPIVAVSMVATVVSLLMFTRYDSGILETDLSKLRNKESLEHGSAYLSRYLDEIFQHYLSPMVILPKDEKDTQEIANRLRELKKKQGPTSSIAAVSTIKDFVPEAQEEKLRILGEIRKLLPENLVQKMDAKTQKEVLGFLEQSAPQAIRMEGLPPLVLSKFTEKDKSVGKLVLVEPPLNNDLWQGEKLIAFIKEIRDVADSVSPGTAVAGTIAVTSDMIEAITHDGPRATLFAFLAVLVLVFILFRDIKSSVLTLFSLLVGVVWLAGIILGFRLKINFLNFIALPITFGIGVDYGVNIFQRYQQEGSASILKVIRNTGGAVALCSFTTIVGYTSLLIASNQGFVSFGLLAVAGELTCVFAAIFSLPALLLVLSKRGKRTPN